MYFKYLVIIGISISINYALANIEPKSELIPIKVCKSDNGYMTLPGETMFLAKFEDENGQNVIIVEDNNKKNLEKEFVFTCHKNHEKNSTKIIFESEESSDLLGKVSPVTRKLKTFDMSINEIATNTEPFSVKCEAVCEVIFIVVDFDVSALCDDNNLKSWNCGIEELENELAPMVFMMNDFHMDEIKRSYQIKNPFNEQPSFYECYDIDRNESYLGLKSCFYVLEQLKFDPKFAPYKILVKMVENEEISYFTKLYYPTAFSNSDRIDIPVWVKLLCVIFLFITILITGCLFYYYMKTKSWNNKGFKKLEHSILISEDMHTIVPI